MSAVYYNVLVGVQNSLNTIVDPPPCVIRYKIQLLEGDNIANGFIIIAPEKERIRKQAFGGIVMYDYPVIVAFYYPGNRLVQTGIAQFMTIRESIRNQLFQPYLPPTGSPITGEFDVNFDAEDVAKFPDWVGSNYIVTGFRFVYTVQETRIS